MGKEVIKNLNNERNGTQRRTYTKAISDRKRRSHLAIKNQKD